MNGTNEPSAVEALDALLDDVRAAIDEALAKVRAQRVRLEDDNAEQP